MLEVALPADELRETGGNFNTSLRITSSCAGPFPNLLVYLFFELVTFFDFV
jgi:hypothetical protein